MQYTEDGRGRAVEADSCSTLVFKYKLKKGLCQLETVIQVFLGLVSGGALFKFADMWLHRKAPKYEMDKALRDELRETTDKQDKKLQEQSARIDALEAESAGWQTKAFGWYQRYKIMKLKALDALIAHKVPIADAQLALTEDNEDWMP